jgi:hypothetical protein
MAVRMDQSSRMEGAADAAEEAAWESPLPKQEHVVVPEKCEWSVSKSVNRPTQVVNRDRPQCEPGDFSVNATQKSVNACVNRTPPHRALPETSG